VHHLHRKTPRRSKPRTQDNSTHQRGIYFSKYLAESSYFTIHPESSSYQVNSWKFTTGFIIATSRWRDREHPWPTQPCLTGWSMNGYDYPILKEITGKRFWVEWPMAYAGFFTWMGYNKTDVFPLLDAPFPDSSLKLGSPAPKECGSTFRRWQWVAVHAALARVLPKSRHAVRSQDRSTLGAEMHGFTETAECWALFVEAEKWTYIYYKKSSKDFQVWNDWKLAQLQQFTFGVIWLLNRSVKILIRSDCEHLLNPSIYHLKIEHTQTCSGRLYQWFVFPGANQAWLGMICFRSSLQDSTQ